MGEPQEQAPAGLVQGLGFQDVFFPLPLYHIHPFCNIPAYPSTLQGGPANFIHSFNMHLLLFLPSIWCPLFTERVAPQEHYPGCEAPPATSQPQLLLVLAPDSLAEVTSCLGVSICTVGIRGCLSPISWDQQMMSQITVGEALRRQKRLFPEPGHIWLMQGLGFAGNPVRCFRESVIKQGEHRVPIPPHPPHSWAVGERGGCVCV